MLALSSSVIATIEALQTYYRSLPRWRKWFLPKSLKIRLDNVNLLNMTDPAVSIQPIFELCEYLAPQKGFLNQKWYVRWVSYWFSGLYDFNQSELMICVKSQAEKSLLNEGHFALLTQCRSLSEGLVAVETLGNEYYDDKQLHTIVIHLTHRQSDYTSKEVAETLKALRLGAHPVNENVVLALCRFNKGIETSSELKNLMFTALSTHRDPQLLSEAFIHLYQQDPRLSHWTLVKDHRLPFELAQAITFLNSKTFGCERILHEVSKHSNPVDLATGFNTLFIAGLLRSQEYEASMDNVDDFSVLPQDALLSEIFSAVITHQHPSRMVNAIITLHTHDKFIIDAYIVRLIAKSLDPEHFSQAYIMVYNQNIVGREIVEALVIEEKPVQIAQEIVRFSNAHQFQSSYLPKMSRHISHITRLQSTGFVVSEERTFDINYCEHLYSLAQFVPLIKFEGPKNLEVFDKFYTSAKGAGMKDFVEALIKLYKQDALTGRLGEHCRSVLLSTKSTMMSDCSDVILLLIEYKLITASDEGANDKIFGLLKSNPDISKLKTRLLSRKKTLTLKDFTDAIAAQNLEQKPNTFSAPPPSTPAVTPVTRLVDKSDQDSTRFSWLLTPLALFKGSSDTQTQSDNSVSFDMV